MKKKIFGLISFIIMLFALSACGKVEETPVTPPSIEIPDDPDNENNNNDNENQDNQGDGEISQEVEFSVSLVVNKKVYIPASGEEIKVIWVDSYAQHTEVIGTDGFAKKKLDGEFNIYLSGCPEGYTYNPNIYTADNESPVVQIELLKIAKVRGGGTLRDEINISSEGTYRATIKSDGKGIFYSFEPKKPGYYSIESISNIYEDVVNPRLDAYNGNAGGTRYFDKTYNSGGASLKGGFTKNFEYIVRLSEDQTAGVFFIFAVYAESKTGVYPIDVDFRITYLEDYIPDTTVAKVMVAEEAGFKTPEFSKDKYVYLNSDHGTGSYYNALSNGTGFLQASDYAYNPDTGYWHVYDKKTNTYGAILCASITKPCAYYEEALSMIESHGNKNLTVSNGTENYKKFIEQDYAAACNSDGVCYVTNELMIFLQKFSVSQRLFFDGNGFVEMSGVYAIEADQWLFACGYYAEK